SRAAVAGTVATTTVSCSRAPIITGNAFDSGRPLTVYRRAIASGRSASTASPYTVSVRYATTPPCRSTATATSSAAAAGLSGSTATRRVITVCLELFLQGGGGAFHPDSQLRFILAQARCHLRVMQSDNLGGENAGIRRAGFANGDRSDR